MVTILLSLLLISVILTIPSYICINLVLKVFGSLLHMTLLQVFIVSILMTTLLYICYILDEKQNDKKRKEDE